MKLTLLALTLFVSNAIQAQSLPPNTNVYYLGCFADNQPRAFPQMLDMYTATTDKSTYMPLCQQAALASGSSFYAMEAGRFCYYGGTSYDKYGSSTRCNQACGEFYTTTDVKPSCGGQWAMDVYVLGHN